MADRLARDLLVRLNRGATTADLAVLEHVIARAREKGACIYYVRNLFDQNVVIVRHWLQNMGVEIKQERRHHPDHTDFWSGNSEAVWFVLFPSLLPVYPPSFVSLQTEQRESDRFRKLFGAHARALMVWDFSPLTSAVVRARGLPVVTLPFMMQVRPDILTEDGENPGVRPTWNAIPVAYAARTPRRAALFDRCANLNHGIFQRAKKAEMLAETSIVLNVHAYEEDSVFELHRISELVEAGIHTVSETCYGLDGVYEYVMTKLGGIEFHDYDDLPAALERATHGAETMGDAAWTRWRDFKRALCRTDLRAIFNLRIESAEAEVEVAEAAEVEVADDIPKETGSGAE